MRSLVDTTGWPRCDCGAIVRRCKCCGHEVDLGSAAWHGDAYDGDAYYGLVKVEGHLGLKVVCLDCIHGPVDLEDRAWRGELTAEEERALRDWWEAS